VITIDLRSYHLGVLKGAGYTNAEIAEFQQLVHTEHSRRPAGPPIGCAADQDEDHPTDGHDSTT
jgi:hypothetical protein